LQIQPRLVQDRTELKREQSRMDVYLIDGTYELFRHFFAVPSAKDMHGQEIGAVS